MRRLTKIICTLGPTAGTPRLIEALAKGGMSVARINLSHGTWEEHRKTIRIVKALNKTLASRGKLPSGIGILLDTQGAEVRTGKMAVPLKIRRGELVVFSHKPVKNERKQVVIVDHDKFAQDVREAERVLVDNGKMSLELVSVRKDGSVVLKAIEQGVIGSRKHINLPGANLDMPSITKNDWISIKNAADEGVDFLGLSFVRKAEEVEEVRRYLTKRGKHITLVAKIETRQAMECLPEIIDASDAVMVARGDLGSEIPFEKMPVAQDDIVRLSRKAGKPVIVATHMLESMIQNPLPTRAEVTDIAHAATCYTDLTMLSAETANGAHPLKALDAMDRVLRETEAHLAKSSRMLTAEIRTERDAQAEAAVTQAISAGAAAIAVMTRTGQTAREIARFRAHLPVIAFTPDASVQRALALSFGVFPLVTPFKNDPETTVVAGIALARKAGLLKKGDRFILVTDARTHEDNVSTIQERKV
ncbi:MAG: pyruvate kinase [Candidatus Peribacteraceae bacterium]|nr:pyruvate kinase [Candidatus Peribacteraceae bacterium]